MRIDGLFNGQPLNQANVLDILSRLNIGDVIKAKVLEMASGELLLKLFDGTVFKAAVTSEINTRPGELLELSVTGKGDGSITLETGKKNIQSESSKKEIKKLLISMNVEPGPENMKLASEFKAAGVKITPEVFEKAAELIRKYNEFTPEKAVFLAAKDIQPELGRVGTLVRLLEGRLKLGKQLDELQTVISSLEKGALAIGRDVRPTAIMAAPPPAPAQQTPVPNAPVFSEPEAAITVQTASKAAIKAASDVEPGQPSPATSPGSHDIAAVNSKPNAVPPKTEEPILSTAVKSQPKNVNEPVTHTAPVTTSAGAGTAVTAGQPQDKNVLLPVNEEGLPITRPDNEKTGETGIKTLKTETENLEKLKTAFKSMFVNTDSEELKSELEVKKLYSDLAEKLDIIKSTAGYSGLPGADEITARINSLNDGIRLLNQINSSTAYYQIPLNINGFNTTGELYVMKREHSRKRIDPKDVTMFISLDTQNIGRIETVIDIKGKNVGMNLRAEEQGIIDFVRENYKHLYNSLLDKGYRLVDIKYRLIEEETNPVKMDRNIKEELANGRYSVDMRI